MKRAAFLMGAALLLAACSAPFESGNAGDGDGDAGVVRVRLSAIEALVTQEQFGPEIGEPLTPIEGGSVVPDVVGSIATFTIRVSDGATTVEQAGITDPGAPIDVAVPVGVWTLSVEGLDENGQIVAGAPPQTLEVTAGEVTQADPIVVAPQQTIGSGFGAAELAISFPPDRVTSITDLFLASLDGQSNQTPPAFSLQPAAGTGTLSIPTLPSGSYLLLGNLQGPGFVEGAPQEVQLNSISVVVQVFDNLTSRYRSNLTGSTTLAFTVDDFGDPPAEFEPLTLEAFPGVASDPPAVLVDLNFYGSFDATADTFLVERSIDGGPFTEAASLPLFPSTTVLSESSATDFTIGSVLTYRLAQINRFGRTTSEEVTVDTIDPRGENDSPGATTPMSPIQLGNDLGTVFQSEVIGAGDTDVFLFSTDPEFAPVRYDATVTFYSGTGTVDFRAADADADADDPLFGVALTEGSGADAGQGASFSFVRPQDTSTNMLVQLAGATATDTYSLTVSSVALNDSYETYSGTRRDDFFDPSPEGAADSILFVQPYFGDGNPGSFAGGIEITRSLEGSTDVDYLNLTNDSPAVYSVDLTPSTATMVVELLAGDPLTGLVPTEMFELDGFALGQSLGLAVELPAETTTTIALEQVIDGPPFVLKVSHADPSNAAQVADYTVTVSYPN